MASPWRPQAASKHWKTFVVEVHGEGPAAAVAPVERAGAAPLRAVAVQPGRQTHLVEHAGHRQLTFDVGKIEGDALADGGRIRYAVGTGRGDHLPRRLCVRPVARGLVVFGRCRVTAVLCA